MAYATIDDVVAVLGLRLEDVDTAALQRIIDAATVEVDQYLDRRTGSPLPDPAPAGVEQATAQLAADLYASQATRWGQLDPGNPDVNVSYVPRDPLRTYDALLAPYAHSHGLA